MPDDFARRLRRESTDAEAVLWRSLRDRQISGRKFRRPHTFGGWILDFYCPTARLAIELEKIASEVEPPRPGTLPASSPPMPDLFGTPVAEPGSAAPFVPQSRSLTTLRAAAKECRGCHLYKYATQTVFGEGPRGAALLLVGEQPGDQEDLQGRPFVGPAGDVLDRALAEAGVDRGEAYVTNVVKHFKFEERGKRRIHKKPGALEIQACLPWLEAELAAIEPRVLVCLGATAAQALLGRGYRLMASRGTVVRRAAGPPAIATIHPSAVLRAPDPPAQEKLYRMIVEDLRAAARLAGRSA